MFLLNLQSEIITMIDPFVPQSSIEALTPLMKKKMITSMKR
jgi:hypothetical protein